MKKLSDARQAIAKAIEIDTDTVLILEKHFNNGRFDNGLKALRFNYKAGSIYNRIVASTAYNTKENTPVWFELLGVDELTICKPDKCAMAKLAELDWEPLKTWYIKTNKFMVSPRSQIAAYAKYNEAEAKKKPETADQMEKRHQEEAEALEEAKKNEKSDFMKISEKIAEARKILEAAIENNTLIKKDLDMIKALADGISKAIK